MSGGEGYCDVIFVSNSKTTVNCINKEIVIP